MRRWCAIVVTGILAALALAYAPVGAATPDEERLSPLGRIGDTLRVQYQDIVADVTVHDLVPVPLPGGVDPPTQPGRDNFYRAQVTVQAVHVPTPHAMATHFTFTGVAPGADGYIAEHTDNPDALLEYQLTRAPQGSTVTGGVYFDAYRQPIRWIVLREVRTGMHLAQWTL
ncbi:hypothetical protein LV457_16735 [Mycobacterium sp. MYCO198283]|uniref:DUF1942 domain-containing protein n=1 Tax=Mycobacterium sp. MYCO198283 TaxID=2883505 RepID=UPI001E310FCF|nr:hypothetical protein [Mycobacterium sp. MYCO198283]MCG5433924.1 hypothetical protein [Mycobacterium sp. MYCO198283]